jgi:hypothetical protein
LAGAGLVGLNTSSSSSSSSSSAPANRLEIFLGGSLSVGGATGGLGFDTIVGLTSTGFSSTGLVSIGFYV